MGLFILGNVLSAVATDLGTFAFARFISGCRKVPISVPAPWLRRTSLAPVMPARPLHWSCPTIATIIGSPLATFLGQSLGWRNTYFSVAAVAGLALIALWTWVPRTQALQGGPVAQELASLRRPTVWAMMLVAALGVASIFAVYTFIGPFVTDAAILDQTWIPVALSLFGLGMTAGNLIGGRLADSYPARGLVVGYGSALIVLSVLAAGGGNVRILMPALFGVGLTMMVAIPTIQVRLTRVAPEAPTLMGAINLAALNVANAIGAWAGSLTIAAGYGLLSAVWAGFGLTLLGVLVFALTLPKAPQPAPA
jgi:DHA1 family inner membrane transport protein